VNRRLSVRQWEEPSVVTQAALTKSIQKTASSGTHAASSSTSTSSSSSASSAHQTSATILLVDDHPPNLMALEAILEPLGPRLLSASSGAEAVEIAARTHEDLALVLLDLQMPELDGLETAALIKKNDRCRHVPIIIVTANEPTHAELARGYATGAVDFLFKPLDPDVLRSKVAVFVQLFERRNYRDRDVSQYRSSSDSPSGGGGHSHSLSSSPKEEGSGRLSERLMAAAPASADQAATVEALVRIHEALSEDLDVANLAQRLAIEATDLTNASGAAILYTTAQGGETRTAFAGSAKNLLFIGKNTSPAPFSAIPAHDLTKLGPVGTLLGPVFDARKVVRHDDVHRASGMHGGPVGSVVAVPIWARASGEVKGALLLVHEAVYAFDARDEELAIVAATHASSALENARLYEQTREAVHRAELAELELRASEARLRIALDAAGLGTWDYNPGNDTLRWDARCRALAGLGPDRDVDYRLFLHGIHPEDRTRVNQAVRTALDPSAEDTTFDVEYRAIGIEDGIERWIAARGLGIAEQGRPVRFIGAMLDVTAKKSEEVERAGLLAAEQRARASAESASRAKDEFLATVSHELRNPLNAILGWSRVLMEERSDATDASSERLKKGLDVILRNAKAQVQLVEDILEVSRIVTGKLRLATRPIDLTATVNMALESVRAGAQAKGVVLEARIDQAIAELTIVADEDRVQQILWNLLSNAVKFTPTNGRVVIAARLPEGESAVELVVQDSGEGIDPEFLPFVFDRFRQFDGSTTRLHGGLGLGLAIVRHLAELHGGRVAALSEGRGKGATFIVALPIARASFDAEGEEEMESTPSVRKRRLSPQALQLLAGRTIVVLDDDEDMRDLIRMILEDAGATVSAHGDVQSAIDALEGRGGSTTSRTGRALRGPTARHVDVAISDLAMPGEDGYAFARRVRSSSVEAARRVPLVAMTAYARAEDRRRVLSAGFDRHVAKPIEPDELIEALAAVIAGAQS
jgi:signal transduction histidine kinase/DNA-binding response OmpR family regulator